MLGKLQRLMGGRGAHNETDRQNQGCLGRAQDHSGVCRAHISQRGLGGGKEAAGKE